MKIGFLLCAFNQEHFLDDCLESLVTFSKDSEHIISCVSVPFLEYKDKNIDFDGTTDILKDKLQSGDIHYLFSEPQYVSEAEARTCALRPLIEEGCDYIFLIDSDEKFSLEDFNKLSDYINKSEFIDWWSISYKNFVGNGYLEDPFTPPRIFKTKTKNGNISHFYFDNDLIYVNDARQSINYKSLASKIIPTSVAWVPHFTWTNTKQNKIKIDYQNKHFGQCSYKWEDDQIKINEDYYIQNNQIKPNIIYDEKRRNGS